jgi:hypothetical protein
MITSIRQIQDKGKTALMVAFIMRLLLNGRKWPDGYKPDDVHVNFVLKIPGVHCYNNDGIRRFIKNSIKAGLRHKIIGITEADRVFPSRFWHDREQSETLLGLWQDVKCHNQVFWDSHIGTSVDVMLRETRQRAAIPHYDKYKNLIQYDLVDGYAFKVYKGLKVLNVSRSIFPYYDRWEIVD